MMSATPTRVRDRSDDLKASTSSLPLIWYSDNQGCLSGNWVIKKVLPAEALVTIIGHPGCGKSFLALDIGLHIATGLDWVGRKTMRGLVLYLAAEGQRGQQNRVEAWKRHHELHDLPFALIPVAINLRDANTDLAKLIETIHSAVQRAGCPLSVLIVDTLNRTFGGGDENGSDMSEYVANIGRIAAEFGCTTIIVHHVPKSSDAISERGHGSLRGAIDTSLLVSADGVTGIRTILCKKQKDAEDGWKLQFKLKQILLGKDDDGDDVTSCVVEPVEPNERRAIDPIALAIAKLPAGPKLAFKKLLELTEQEGFPPPAVIPKGEINRLRVGKVVMFGTWREKVIMAAGTDRDTKRDTAKRAFNRAVDRLQNDGIVRVWGDYAWRDWGT